MFNKYYQLKISQGKGHRCAQGHCVRKLLRIIYQMSIRDRSTGSPLAYETYVSDFKFTFKDGQTFYFYCLLYTSLNETEFMKRLDENEYFYDESTNQIKTK